jgi:hypothetical protein
MTIPDDTRPDDDDDDDARSLALDRIRRAAEP